MDVLKAYSDEVVSYHPRELRADLGAELYANLCEEFGDWSEANPEGDEARFLDATKEHPMKYATRLAGEDSPGLIGPQFYYSFVSALKIGATVTTVFYLLLAFVLAVGSGSYIGAFFGVMVQLPIALLWVGAAILGVFVALERSGERASWLDQWSAASLRPADGQHRISRAETLFDLGFSTFALLWVLNVVQLPAVIRHDGAWVSEWIGLLPTGFWWLAGGLLAADILFSALRLFRSHWSPILRVVKIAVNVAWIALLAWAVSQPALVALVDAPDTGLADLADFINHVADNVLLVICAILAWDTGVHAWRLLKRR